MRLAPLLLPLVLAAMPLPQTQTLDGRAAVILDGDTVAIGAERIRILDIEAPGISKAAMPLPQTQTLDGRAAVILDGDTVAIGAERIRILDIEAPGISEPECEREEIFALRSRQRLAELVRSGPITIQRSGRDRLGRTLARLFLADGREIAAILVAEGLALPWQDSPEAKASRRQHWCG